MSHMATPAVGTVQKVGARGDEPEGHSPFGDGFLEWTCPSMYSKHLIRLGSGEFGGQVNALNILSC